MPPGKPSLVIGGPHYASWCRGSLQPLSLSRLVQAGSLGFPSVLSATLPVLDMQLPCLYESEFVSVLATPEIPKKTSSEGGLVSRWGFMEVSVRWDCPQADPKQDLRCWWFIEW